MKKILLFLFCFPLLVMAQQTYVPDDNFEAYLEANGMGNGIINDDYVTTSSIDTVPYLGISALNISDLTGIEDFTTLTFLDCYDNQLTSLDISQNAIDFLICYNNQITTINLNTDLYVLDCSNNNITNLNVSANTNLTYLYCSSNQLTNISLTTNTALIDFRLEHNQFSNLDLSNNINLEYLNFYNNQLTLIDLSQNSNLISLYHIINNKFFYYVKHSFRYKIKF